MNLLKENYAQKNYKIRAQQFQHEFRGNIGELMEA